MTHQPPVIIQASPNVLTKRNSKWLVPLACAGAVVVIAGFITLFACGIFILLRSSDVSKSALARAKAEPAVIEALGEPIREGFLITGNIHLNGASGNANLSIPISGPKGDAKIYVEAYRKLGQWTFQNLVVEIKGTGKRIDISRQQDMLKEKVTQSERGNGSGDTKQTSVERAR